MRIQRILAQLIYWLILNTLKECHANTGRISRVGSMFVNMTSGYVAKKNVNHDIHMSLANQYFRSFTTNTTPTAKHTTLLPSHYKLPLDKIQPLLTRINTFKIDDTKVHSSLYRNIYRLRQNRLL